MLVGIHKDPLGQFSDYKKRYEDILRYNGIECVRLDASEPDFWDKVAKLDLFIFHWGQYDTVRQMAHTVIPIVEKEYGIPCLPDYKTCWHYDDKIREYYLLKSHGFPVAHCWIFWEKDAAIEWLETATFPVVFKLTTGAGSNNVILINNKKETKKIINKMFANGVKSGLLPFKSALSNNSLYNRFKRWTYIKREKIMGRQLAYFVTDPPWQLHKNYVLFQEYLPDNLFDNRIITIGERAFVYRRFNRPDDFRGSGSGIKDLNPANVDLKCVKIALQISNKMKFQSMAYDFLYNSEKKPKIIEISYAFPDLTVKVLPGYWDASMNWHEGHFWPQYLCLVDSLKMTDLEQPEIPFEKKWDYLKDGEMLHPRIKESLR